MFMDRPWDTLKRRKYPSWNSFPDTYICSKHPWWTTLTGAPSVYASPPFISLARACSYDVLLKVSKSRRKLVDSDLHLSSAISTLFLLHTLLLSSP